MRNNNIIRKILILTLVFIFCSLVSCDSSQPISPTEEIKSNDCFSIGDVEAAEKCWLKSFGLDFGKWSNKGKECIHLARELTDAAGYGEGLGGYDYVVQQLTEGNKIPLLSEIKDKVNECDNLILTGDGYDRAGHTVVVFRVDLRNDIIYYLEQNYNGKPISPNQKSISSIEDRAYVIVAKCNEPNPCLSNNNCGPIIALPESSKVPEISSYIETENIPSPETSNDGVILFTTLSNGSPNSQIYSINSDGTNFFQLTELRDALIDSFVWSKSTYRIVFSPQFNVDERPDINTVNIDGSEVNTILDSDDYPYYSPDWSPDGLRIVYDMGLGMSGNSINIMNKDGSDSYEINPNNHNCSSPKWSPDGFTIIFTCWDNDHENIHSFSLITNEISNLTNNEGNNYQYSWSPCGQKIAFVSTRDGDAEIFIMNADGSSQTQITNNSSNDFNPVWSPDGSKILFSSDLDGHNGIYYMNVDGSNQIWIIDGIWGAVWSPAGDQIAFVSDINGEIYSQSINGGTPTQITQYQMNIMDILWIPKLEIEDDINKATINPSLSSVQIGWKNNLYLRYDSNIWETFKYETTNEDGEMIFDLINKTKECSISGRVSLGSPNLMNYEISNYQNTIGSLSYEINEYKLLPDKEYIVTIFHPFSLERDISIYLTDNSGTCLQNAEDVLLASEEAIID